MAAQFLRNDTRLTPISRSMLRILKDDVEEACENQHTKFFRIANRAITFRESNVNYRIDVDTATDADARRQMNLPASTGMLYAQLQTGSGQTIANIVYPANEGSVQLGTLVSALQQSMARRAIFTAIH